MADEKLHLQHAKLLAEKLTTQNEAMVFCALIVAEAIRQTRAPLPEFLKPKKK